ncbi:DNA repair protein RecN [mine drainage metagenome]|uniref:DNA repair protein RecN n=1 Tax=mine drainage metagenome TaxID=410659 RepID=A0A1J5Q672_9ZZZZ
MPGNALPHLSDGLDMLISLSLRDFVIVDRLDLEFERGFTVLTGETGAGKSILIDALSLALGARGEAGMVRQGCEKAEISAEFSVGDLPQLQAWLQEHELAGDDGGCLMRRILYADGRSRAFINGFTATMQQLREAGEFLVDIYSQHAHHSLLKSTTQRALLDDFAGAVELAGQVATRYRQWRERHDRRAEMERNAALYAEELAELRDQVRELAQLNPSREEWEALQQEHSRLAHAASLLSGGEECREYLAENEFSALRQLHAAQHKLQELLEYDPALQEALDGIASAAILVTDVDRFLNKYLGRGELDPERLLEVEARIQAIHGAARKYRVRPEELPETLEKWRSRMTDLEGAGDDGALAREEAMAHAEYRQSAEQLSDLRRQAAARLGEQVSAEMQRLALSGGRFAVALDPLAEGAAFGLEQVEFQVAGHAGMEPRPLAKVASGGELSRISLAIRVITAQRGETPTMIFDEVDVGIGGGVAEVVGQMLKDLGRSRQVLVITHLPQVAAQGVRHLRVSKSSAEGKTLSRMEALEPGARVDEIARMLGGVEITETTRKHAREMLGM